MRPIRLEDLDDGMQKAVHQARDALPRAYAPYSGFRVACCILLDGQEPVIGVNVENASYGLSICAERAAVFQAVQGGLREFQGIVVASETEEPATPCGACRQVLSEFAVDLPVVLVGSKSLRECTLSELLPHAFRDWRPKQSP